MFKCSALSASLMLLSSVASAATISVQTFTAGEYANRTSGMAVVEHFEDFSSLSGSFESGDAFTNPNEGTLNGALETSVGRFSAIGCTGTGTDLSEQ